MPAPLPPVIPTRTLGAAGREAPEAKRLGGLGVVMGRDAGARSRASFPGGGGGGGDAGEGREWVRVRGVG